MQNDVLDLLSQGMGTSLHWFPEDFSISRLAETLVGMSNASGGVVLIGIAPRSNRLQGVRNSEAAKDRVFQAALMADPPLILPLPLLQFVDKVRILKITVPPGLPHVYNLEGRYLIREGHRTQTIPPTRLRRLLMDRGVEQFETRLPPEAGLDDLDWEQVSAYRETLKFPREASLEEILERRGCLRRQEGELRPTYAGILLFGRHPQQWVPSATILAARFPGVSISDEFIKQEIGGSLAAQLLGAVAFGRDNMRSVVRLVGLTRKESLEYPLEAVRELLVNAVAHRDYSQHGDSIHLHIFSDRLEVRSPGRLPGPVNLSNLLEARFSRNAVIAQVLSDLGFVERLGYGLKRVVAVVRQNGHPEPRFEEVGGSFRVTLFASSETQPEAGLPDLSAYRSLELNPRQELALNHVAKERRITNRAYQELCPDVSPETLRRDLADMVDKGLLLKIGDKRATYYILK